MNHNKTAFLKTARRAVEAFLLLTAAVAYNGLVFGKMTYERYGFEVHPNFIGDGYADFVGEVLTGMIAGLLALIILRWLSGWRVVSFLIASITSTYFGMPYARLFGNTWAKWEPSNELFLRQLDLVVPITMAAVTLYAGYSWYERKLFDIPA